VVCVRSDFLMKTLHFRFASYLVAVALVSPAARAKNKHEKQPTAQPQDQITVQAHIPVPQGAVTGFVITRHYDRRYAYAQRTGGEPMVIDITRLDAPRVLPALTVAGGAASEKLVAVAGTAVVTSDAAAIGYPPKPQTIRIIDYSDAAHPKVTKEFAGVTAISNQNGVILLANSDGIWILSQKLAEDPEDEARYARKVVYGESRY
jgi:hypothetical protein